MKRIATLAALAAALVIVSLPLAAQQPEVSEKKEVAIFALGHYGWAIPQEVLGNIDMQIRKVITDLGRFTVLAYPQTFKAEDVDKFVGLLSKAKLENFVMPEKYQLGEAFLTEADLNKLLKAFIVAIPVVTNFNSTYSQEAESWITELKTNVTFIDVAEGVSLGITEVKTTGSDSENQLKSITSAVDSIPTQLEYEIRKIPAFQISTRILAVKGKEIKLQLGTNMGIKRGDEYAIVTKEIIEGIENESEQGLVTIKAVDKAISTGQVVYASVPLAKDLQLREIPRMGFDGEGYLSLAGGTAIIGLRSVATRGFYAARPYFALQIPLSDASIGLADAFVANAVFGGELNLFMGRLALTPYAGAGVGYGYVSETEASSLSHYGAQGGVKVSMLFGRDLKVFGQAGGEYWLSADDETDYYSFGGVSFGAGVSFKL